MLLICNRRLRGRLMIAAIAGLIVAGSLSQAVAQSTRPAIPITGRERLEWDQAADSPLALAGLEHVVHVDGLPVEVDGLACGSTQGPAGYVCSSRLPAMTPGEHAINVVTRVRGAVPEVSASSSVILVRLAASTSIEAGPAHGQADTVIVTSDGVRLRRTTLAATLDDPTDMTVLPDGRVLIAERSGRVLVLRDGALDPSPALLLAGGSRDGVTALLALTADRDFATSREVFALYATDRGLTVARFTEANGKLVNRAVLLDGLPASGERPTATLRMGADRKLYVGLGLARSRDGRHDAYGGKVLRLNRDGTTPDDQEAMTPIVTSGVDHPNSMEWTDSHATLWLAGFTPDGGNRLRAIRFDPNARVVATRDYSMPADLGRAFVSRYSSDVVREFRGNIFIAGASSGALLRTILDDSGEPVATEWLFREAVDAVHALTTLPDGSLLVATRESLVTIARER